MRFNLWPMVVRPFPVASNDNAGRAEAAGNWLRSLRLQRDLTRRQLAQAIGIDGYEIIGAVEAGHCRIPPELFEAWANALGFSRRVFVLKLLEFYEPETIALLRQQGLGPIKV
jgi:transcriptional regulator with XRE-family HTH domain